MFIIHFVRKNSLRENHFVKSDSLCEWIVTSWRVIRFAHETAARREPAPLVRETLQPWNKPGGLTIQRSQSFSEACDANSSSLVLREIDSFFHITY